MSRLFTLVVLIVVLCGCGDEESDNLTNPIPEERRNITTANFIFDQDGGNTLVSVQHKDPDGIGGQPPLSLDTVELKQFTFFDLKIEMFNELDPNNPLDISAIVREEADQHRFFFTGNALDSTLIVLNYVDTDLDADGQPLGLQTFIIPVEPGEEDFNVRLKYIPRLPSGASGKSVATYASGGTIMFETSFKIRVVE